MPFWEPKKRRPWSSSGEDSLALGSLRDQRMAPVWELTATTRPGAPERPPFSSVTYTVLEVTAGVEADSCPRRCVQTVWPVLVSTAISSALSASWKMRSP